MAKRRKAQQRAHAKVLKQRLKDSKEVSGTSNLREFPFPSSETFESDENRRAWQQTVSDWIREEARQLESTLLQLDAYDVLSYLILTEIASDAKTYKETTHSGTAAIVEYIALLFLKHPYNSVAESIMSFSYLSEIRQRVNLILSAASSYYGAEPAHGPSQEISEALDNVRASIVLDELFVRSPGYIHHQQERLTSIFSDFEPWLLENLGFSLADAIAIDEAIEKHMIRSLAEFRTEMRRLQKELLIERQRLRKGQEAKEPYSELVQQLAKLSNKQAAIQAESWSAGTFFSTLGRNAFSFTSGDLAVQTDIPTERVDALLRYFAIDFGSVSPDFFMPSPTHELKLRPLLHHENVYLCPVPRTIIWALQPRLEETFKLAASTTGSTSQQPWKRFSTVRARYLEQESLRLLQNALRYADVYSNLKYDIIENGQSKKTELDGLICYDTSLFLIENKAGSFTSRARSGAYDRILRDAKDLIGEAHRQAVRAKQYIESSTRPEFKQKDGTIITLDKSRFNRTFMVTVSLEPLDPLNTVLHDLAKMGVFQEGDLPWAVSLDTLRVICEISEFPAQLIHYLLRRLRINELGKIVAHDELDWYGHYLSKGLFFDKEDWSEYTMVHLPSYTTDFDDYYLHEMGRRKKATQKPVQPMPKRLHDIIVELEAKHSYGYSEAIVQLLQFDSITRDKFSKMFEKARAMTRRDGDTHDFTIISTEGKSGISSFSATSRNFQRALEKMEDYIRLKKHQQRADKWLGLLSIVDGPELVRTFLTRLDPWSPDAKLDQEVAKRLSS